MEQIAVRELSNCWLRYNESQVSGEELAKFDLSAIGGVLIASMTSYQFSDFIDTTYECKTYK